MKSVFYVFGSIILLFLGWIVIKSFYPVEKIGTSPFEIQPPIVSWVDDEYSEETYVLIEELCKLKLEYRDYDTIISIDGDKCKFFYHVTVSVPYENVNPFNYGAVEYFYYLDYTECPMPENFNYVLQR